MRPCPVVRLAISRQRDRGLIRAAGCLSAWPDPALVGARVQLDATAGPVEDHNGIGGVEGAPSGVASAGEADPGRVHLVGQRLRRRGAGHELAAGRGQIIEHERDLQRVAGAQAAGGAAPGELVEIGWCGPGRAGLGDGQGGQPEIPVGDQRGEQVTGGGIRPVGPVLLGHLRAGPSVARKPARISLVT